MNNYKRIPCPDCEGIGIIRPFKPIAFAGETPVVFQMEACPRCHGNRTICVPLTFADWIRSMTDEELAGALIELTNGYDPAAWYCQNKQECGDLMDADEEIPNEMCKACLLAKLRQPYEKTRLPKGMYLDKQESGLLEED